MNALQEVAVQARAVRRHVTLLLEAPDPKRPPSHAADPGLRAPLSGRRDVSRVRR